VDRDLQAKLRLFRAAASVIRVHTRRMIYRQSVGEHTFGVIALITLVKPEATVELLRAALVHDVPEAITGDVPSPTKNTALREAMMQLEYSINRRYSLEEVLSVHDERVLRYCDVMELAMFSCEEADMGNSYAALMMRRCLDAIEAHGLATVTPQALELFAMMRVRCNGFGHERGMDTLYRTEEC
jgi:5'-deoxynucleotidase YfbR-like HD superfamily hydrolase